MSYIFLSNTPTCILVHFALSLLCFCWTLRDPSCIPCLRKIPIAFNLTCTHEIQNVSLQESITSYATTLPLSFYFIVRRVVLEWLRRMRCISLRSVCPRGPLRLILSSMRLELCISLPRTPDAPAPPVACPLDPAPRVCVWSRPQCRDAGCALCTNRQYVDMIAHSPPSRLSSTCPFLLPPALWLYRKTRCGCCWGEMELAC